MAGNTEAAKPHRPGRLSRWMFAALMLAAALFAIWTLAPQTIGETARRKFLCLLQDHYPDHLISIRRGHFDPKVGLIFEDIRIGESSSSMLRFRSREMLRIERLTVITDLHTKKLVDQQNPFVTRRVLVEGVTANVWLDDKNEISLASLMPLPKFGPVAPRIDVRQISLRLAGDDPTSRPIDAELSEIVVLNHPRSDDTTDYEVSVQGAGDFFNHVSLKIVKRDGTTDIRCAGTGIHFDRVLFDRLPSNLCSTINHAKELTCDGDVSFAYFRDAAGGVNYRVQSSVHDGQFSHPVLPQTITGLRGMVVCDPDGVTIEGAQANLGDAMVQVVTGRLGGHHWPCDADLKIRTRGLMLDERLAAALPASVQDQWQKLQPVGRIDIDANLAHRSGSWQTDAELTCKGVDIRYEKFPYPIEQAVGRISLRDNIVSSEGLSGRIASNRMQCAFHFPTKREITNERSFVIATDGPIPIDHTLIESLSPRGGGDSGLESFVRSLKPRGSVKLALAVFATDHNGRQTRKIDLEVIDGYIRYEKFAYPLHNVSGKVEVENELVKLIGFRGTNTNAGMILCDGAYQIPVKDSPTASYRISDRLVSDQSESKLALNFRASNVPMDESLRSSLPWSTQQVWDALSPNGVLDDCVVTIGKVGEDRPISMDITARQFEHGQVTNRMLSIRPSSLPYRLDITGGTVHFDGARVNIQSLNASHEASKISADGACVQGDDGRWVLSTNLHSGSRLHPDAELIAALPSQMRETMKRLQLRGPVSVRGNTRLVIPDEANPEPVIDWDIDLQLEGNRIADAGSVHSLRGEISVNGMRSESVLRIEGDVKIDSMHVNDLQITGIRGPFSIDGDRLYIGATSVDRKIRPTTETIRQSQPIQGQLFGGTINVDGEVVLSSGDYDVDMSVQDARVPTLLADFGQSENDLTGSFSVQSSLQGNLGTNDLLRGNGSARVGGANLYQLPLIVQVLNMIRVTPTEDVAFTDGQVEFALFGDTVTFSEMQLWGDLVSLQGGGTLNRWRDLDLTFNTRVSPQNTFTKIIRPLRSQKYTLMTIDVSGTLNDVRVERRALDGVGETLERLFPGMNKSDSEPQEDTAANIPDRRR